MNKRVMLAMIATMTLPLTGCGGAGGGGGSGGGGLLGGSWDAADACKLFSKDKVAQVMGAAVKEEKLEGVTTLNENGIATSSCSYTLADDRVLSFTTRSNTDGTHTPQEIVATRAKVGEVMPQTFEDVSGLAGTAYWATKTKQLNLFPNPNRWIMFTLAFAGTGPMHSQGSSEELKAKAIALAHAAGY